jgi:chaperonin GroEL|tara:strand:+ start:773 stop:2404 length:1632 start_codon:yes stop_codon:yes gene_type:complete
MSNYIPKNLDFGDEGRKKLNQGITKISQAVKSTLGPRGRTVLIESTNHLGGLIITKDGVTVANDFFLDDAVENLSAQMMKEAARKTANTAGDGTTTAIVLTEAIVNAGNRHIDSGNNVSEVVKYINAYSKDVVNHLTKKSKKVTKDVLNDVATISANNDKDLGRIISDAYNKVGDNGIVTIERSQNHETYATVTNGIKVDRGYTSNLFVTDNKNDESVLEDVYILVCDQEISNLLQLEVLLKTIVSGNKKLLIIGPCSTNVVQTLAANVMRNGLKLCNIMPPQFGYKQHELMQDIALSVGAKYFSEKTGDDLSLISFEDLGHADKIISGTTQTVIIKNNQMTEEIKTRISDLKEQQANTDIVSDREFINERIASLSGSIGSIFVGANTDIEQKEKYDRVEDAVCAVRSALEEGIVKGGGLALFYSREDLYNKSFKLMSKEAVNYDEITAINILLESLCSPLSQILQNAGLNIDEYYNVSTLSDSWILQQSSEYNVKTEEFGDFFEMGVIDPLKVTKTAFTNAVSVATTILTTNAIITHARVKQ